MSKLRNCLILLLAFLGLNALADDPTITVSARQRYPWNGLVDLTFTVTGTSGMTYDTSFTARDVVGNTNITMRTIRKADGTAAATTEQLFPGAYTWVWDAAADLPKDWKNDRVTVTGTAVISPFPYSVKFNANGGTGTMSNESFTYGTAKALTANAFTRTGYTFQGWATSASGEKVYNDKQSVSNLTTTSGAVVNLYAVWNAISYSVKFNANGGTGTMSNESFTYGTAKALTANAFTRTGYTFYGWATSASGERVYTNNQSVSNLATTSGAVVNLYAMWMFARSKVQLWSGGPYWALTNIGADNSYDYGYYFWWGDTIGYKRQNSKWVAANGSSSNYSFTSGNTPTHNKSIATLKSQGWITSANVLAPNHDAARVQWGGNWRMPTDQELSYLVNKCTWTWTTKNGVQGYVVKGKGDYASASIFLPAPGLGSGSTLGSSGYGYYWSSVPNSSGNATSCSWTLVISSSSHGMNGNYVRSGGQSIRPVCSP